MYARTPTIILDKNGRTFGRRASDRYIWSAKPCPRVVHLNPKERRKLGQQKNRTSQNSWILLLCPSGLRRSSKVQRNPMKLEAPHIIQSLPEATTKHHRSTKRQRLHALIRSTELAMHGTVQDPLQNEKGHSQKKSKSFLLARLQDNIGPPSACATLTWMLLALK